MGSTADHESTDVVICGCGPTGAMLSVLLGQRGVRNIVLEREPDITTDPRGIALDEDGIRYLQACGIYKDIFTDIGECMGKFMFVGGAHHDLRTKPFLAMNYTTTEGGTGHPGFMCHKQPSIEKHLRSQISRLPTSDLRVSSTLTGIREDEEWVYVTYNDAQGKEHRLRSKFLAGADGKTGHTRKNYLEPRGIRLEKARQATYEEVWVALNWKISLPTPETHPDFPLWAKGFSPQDVYDLFFPTDFRFLCNPDRAAVCGRFGLRGDRLWRFEYVVLPGEDGTEMAKPEKMREVVFPYITHAGSRYGLSVQDIQFPSDCIEVLRCRPFNFSARSCNKWALNRVVLCGDAAHVFPPFGGQGIASGFRDAVSLSWRLVLACQGTPNYRNLLQGWYSERKQQLDMSLASTVENGDYVTESNRLRIFLRDWYLWLLQLVPAWKHWLEMGNRRDGMTRYKWEDGKGMAFLPNMGGGGNFPQVYCVCINDHPQANKVHFTDDIIFARSKAGLFQLVMILPTLQDLPTIQAALAGIEKASHGALRPDEATFIVDSTQPPTNKLDTNRKVYRLATGEEFAADGELCRGRPRPQHYDPWRLSKEVHNSRFVILRPDRFVFAACSSQNDLFQAASQLAQLGQTSL